MPAIAIPIGVGLGKVIAAAIAAVVVTAVVVAAAEKIIDIVGDYLDEKAREKEYVDRVRERVGEKSKAEQRRLQDCKTCKWCLVIIQAQGVLVGGSSGSTMSLGPYVVEGRTVFANEGIILLGATQLMLDDALGRRALKQILALGAFARTAKYILERPPAGLPPGRMDYRAGGGGASADREFRYDIGVMGTISAFLS